MEFPIKSVVEIPELPAALGTDNYSIVTSSVCSFDVKEQSKHS